MESVTDEQKLENVINIIYVLESAKPSPEFSMEKINETKTKALKLVKLYEIKIN
jgi:hypothetical protein